jgi:hypothetical protein
VRKCERTKLMDHEPVPTVPLGLVQSGVRVGEGDFIRLTRSVFGDFGAEGRDRHGAPPPGEQPQDRIGRGVASRPQDDHELFTAEPRDAVSGSDGAPQMAAEGLENLVADLVPEAVVYVLEQVQIEYGR